MLVDKMCKSATDPVSIVEDTQLSTDGRTDGGMDG